MFKKAIRNVLVITGFVTVFLASSGMKNEVRAESFEQSISDFPSSYKTYLRELHKKYPNWRFEALQTGLNFETVIDNEMNPVSNSPDNKSLIWKDSSSLLKRNESCDYNASTGTYYYKDSKYWHTASRAAVSWFVDPRNWLNEVNIMQFEKNSYDASVQTLNGVKSILSGSFMQYTSGKTYSYLNTKGKKVNSKSTYASDFYNAGKKYGISPYYLASKSVQELGRNGSGSCSGKYTALNKTVFKGIYNFYNIGANDGKDPIYNGLTFAKSGTTYGRSWTSPQKAIYGGAEYFYTNYISQNQYTGYLVRFNVASANATFSHQFMTNIGGASQETYTTYNAYSNMGVLSDAKVFIIPVYKHMPRMSNTISIKGASNTGITISKSNIRTGAGISYPAKAKLAAGASVTVLEGKRVGGQYSSQNLVYPYWYKVKYKLNGVTSTGYILATSVRLTANKVVTSGAKLSVSMKDSSDAVYFRSSNPAIVTVSDQGVITVKKNGYATIYAMLANGRIDAIRINAAKVILNRSEANLTEGKKLQLKAKLYKANVKKVSWTSSNSKVAAVTNGLITAKSGGVATITIKASGGVKASCKVTVKPKSVPVKISSTSYKSLTLSWTKSASATGYRIYRSEKKNGTYQLVKTVTKNDTSWTDSGLTCGEHYYYRILVYKKRSGVSYESSKTSTDGIVKPGMSSKITIKKDKKNVIVSWKKVSGSTGYILYRKVKGGSYKKLWTDTTGKRTYTDKSIKIGKQYTYCIKAYRKVGQKNHYGDGATKTFIIK